MFTHGGRVIMYVRFKLVYIMLKVLWTTKRVTLRVGSKLYV
jgi:hypothetical protein